MSKRQRRERGEHGMGGCSWQRLCTGFFQQRDIAYFIRLGGAGRRACRAREGTYLHLMLGGQVRCAPEGNGEGGEFEAAKWFSSFFSDEGFERAPRAPGALQV